MVLIRKKWPFLIKRHEKVLKVLTLIFNFFYTWRIGFRSTLNRLLKIPKAFSTTRLARDNLKKNFKKFQLKKYYYHFSLYSFILATFYALNSSQLQKWQTKKCTDSCKFFPRWRDGLLLHMASSELGQEGKCHPLSEINLIHKLWLLWSFSKWYN